MNATRTKFERESELCVILRRNNLASAVLQARPVAARCGRIRPARGSARRRRFTSERVTAASHLGIVSEVLQRVNCTYYVTFMEREIKIGGENIHETS